MDSKVDKLYIEFGVMRGSSINEIAKNLNKINKNIYGFDSFYGLAENWYGTHNIVGAMSTKGKLPKVQNNVKLVVGNVQETLEKFLLKHNEHKINFVY